MSRRPKSSKSRWTATTTVLIPLLCLCLLVEDTACVFLFAQGYVLGRLVGRIKGSLSTTTRLGSPYLLGRYVIRKAVALNMMRRGVLIGMVGKPFIDAAVMKKGLEAQAALLMMRRRPLAYLLNPFLRRRESEDKDKSVEYIHTKDDLKKSTSSKTFLPLSSALKLPTIHVSVENATPKPQNNYFATPPTPVPYRHSSVMSQRQSPGYVKQITYYPSNAISNTTPPPSVNLKNHRLGNSAGETQYVQTSYYSSTQVPPYKYSSNYYTSPVSSGQYYTSSPKGSYNNVPVQTQYYTSTQVPSYNYYTSPVTSSPQVSYQNQPFFKFLTTSAPGKTPDGPIFAGIEINFGRR